jgi:hypothetical protein
MKGKLLMANACPVHGTTQMLTQWCTDNFHPIVTKGTTMINWTLIGDVVIAVAAYEVGKFGLKTIYTYIRGLFAKPAVATTQPA